MSTIPGPIIRFRFDTTGATQVGRMMKSAAGQVEQDFRKAGAVSASATVAAWKTAAAQLRASMSVENLGLEKIVSARKAIIALAEKDISLYQKKAELSSKELSSLRSATMEVERQRNALQGRGALTSATQQFIDAFKVRVGGFGGSGNMFGGMLAARAYEPVGKFLTEGAGKFEEVLGPAAIAIGGVTAGIVAMGVAAALTTKHMIDLAQSIENSAAATGLTTEQTQVYNRLAKEMGVDAGSLEMAFARIQSQLGEYVTTGKAAGSGSQYFVKVMNELGVSLTEANHKLRPVNDILGDFSNKLQKIPDQETRTALEMEALGTRGRILTQVMNQASLEGKSLGDMLQEIAKSGIVIPDAQLNSLMQAKLRWDELTRSVEAYKIKTKGAIASAALHPGKFLLDTIMYTDMGIPVPQAKTTPGKSAASSNGNPLAVANLTAANEQLAEKIKLLRAGGETQLQLLQAQAGLAAAINSHNKTLIALYNTQISQLRTVLALEGKTHAPTGSVRAFTRLLSGGMRGVAQPTLRQAGRAPLPMTATEALMYKYFGVSPLAVPNISASGNAGLEATKGFDITSLTGPLSAVTFSNSTKIIQQLHDKILESEADAVGKINIQYNKELDNFRAMEAAKVISHTQFIEAQTLLDRKRQDDLKKIQQEELQQYKRQGEQLFDALVGGSKNFGQMLTRMLEGVVLAPIKDVFANLIAHEMLELEKIIKGGGSSGAKGGKSAAHKGILGKILDDVGKIFGIGAGNQRLSVAQQNVTAQQVTIIAGSILGAGAGAGGGLNFLSPMGFMGFGSQQKGGLLSNPIISGVASAMPGAVLLGAGLYSSNPAAIALGIGMTGGSALTSISNALLKSNPSSTLGNVLGKVGSVLPGLGLIAAGTQTGGLGGAAMGAAGGLQIGSALTPILSKIFSSAASEIPILGPLIGAGVGALIGGLFGGGSAARHAANWKKAIDKAMRREQIILPPSETFAFAAMNSMAQTFRTTFSGSNGSFSNAALAANLPFYASAILGYPKTGGQLTAFQQALGLINTGVPFGPSGSNPFTGAPLPPGTSPYSMNAATVVHIQVDGKTIATAVARHLPNSVAMKSSGMQQASFAANNLP